MSTFPHLLQPGWIGAMSVRNRLVMSLIETMYGTPDGLPSDRTRDYFAARAQGGVGLITVGATGIDHLHPKTPGGLHNGTDAAVDAHRALVETVHQHGAKIQPQIVHAGPDGLGPEMRGVTSLGPLGDSVVSDRAAIGLDHRAAADRCADLFKAAVRRAAEAGYDGIELHAAHGYMLLGSFLAPQRNRRTDDYRGDSARGRIRVVLETLAAIRAEIGDALPITLRISGYERVAGGRPIHETAQVAPELVAAGVDAFHVSGGVIDQLVTGMANGSDDADGLNVGAAAAVKEVVDVPVIVVGRIHDPERAEQMLADGRADFIAMSRPLLGDPDLPRKLRSGQAHRIRKCISCENCIDTMELRFSVDCAVNPRTGKERELTPRRARSEIGNKRKTEHMNRLDRLGVTVHVRTAVEQITEDTVVFTPAGGTTRHPAADTVVVAGTPEPATTLFDTLVPALPDAEVHAAGDCTGLGLIRKATEDGARAACAIQREPSNERSGMSEETAQQLPALTASRASWQCVQARDREGWLALMADDVVVEDPIGKAITNPDGTGVRGKERVGGFYDTNIAANQLTITCEETFPSSSPNEIAHILILHSKFDNGIKSKVRGVFTYRVNDAGLITNMRGYWNLDAMTFGTDE